MAELRTDPLTGDRVVVAPARAQRPGAWDAPEDRDEPGRENCPFCEGHETETPPEIFAIADARRQEPDTPGWRVRVAPNKFPAFGPQGAPSASGMFVAEAAVGWDPTIGAIPVGTMVAAHNPRVTIHRTVIEFVYQPVVREALKKITGQDFEFNSQAWRDWLRRRESDRGAAIVPLGGSVGGHSGSAN